MLHVEKWRDCAKPSIRLLPVIIMTIALCCASCSSTRKMEKREWHRQTTETTIRQTLRRLETVPGTTRLTVDLHGVLHLPEGASYTLCQDGIRATLVRKGNRLMVEAQAEQHILEETDILQAECQEEEYDRQDEQRLENHSNGIKTRFKWYMAGMATMAILLLLLAWRWIKKK